MKVYEKAPAKINLTLDVLHKRPDGYHELKSVMTTVDLYDRLELSELQDDAVVIESQVGIIPVDEKNLAYQAASLVKEHFGIQKGVHIKLDKHIPVSAGLAGGSSDAAATLRGLNRLWQLDLSIEELKRLGEEIGSDVPFCVQGKTALATGRGEQLTPLPSPPHCWVILAKPAVNVSTAEIYRRLDLQAIVERPQTEWLIEALERKDYKAMCASLGNVLESSTLPLYPQVEQLKSCMIRLGADGVLMSGSGPTVFGLVQKESKARSIYNGLRGFCKQVYVVRLLTE